MTPADDDDSLRDDESPDEPDERERSEPEGDEHAAASDDGDDGEDGDDIEILGFSAADEAGVAIEDPDDFDEPGDDDEEEIVLLDDDEGDDAASPPVDDETVRALREELQEARGEAEDLKQRLVRQAAEADNFRKRVERERVEERKQAAAGLVKDLLPILDNFERALEQGREKAEEDPSVSSFLDGFRLIEEQLSDILRRAGLEPVDASGTFDPNVHEALMQEPTTDAPHLSVLKVFEQGWRFQGRLLRPARVVVASNPDAARGGEAEADDAEPAPDGAPDAEAGVDGDDADDGGGNTTDGSDEADGDDRATSRGETD